MEGNPHFSTLVPPTMSYVCKPRFIGSTSRESIHVNNQFDNSRGFFRRSIHANLDLYQPLSDLTLILANDPLQIHRPRVESPVLKIGLGQLLEDTIKRGFTELGENEKSVGVDLTLRLSPPQVGDEADQVATQLGSSSGTHLDLKSKKVHADGGKPRELSSIVMGCTNCWMYVMVSETNPTCPNCNSFILLDKFRGDQLRA